MSAIIATEPHQGALDLPEPIHYHTDAWGWFSVLARKDSGYLGQKSYPLSQLPAVIQCAPKDRDCYISQAEFLRPNRRVINLARVGLLFLDIDPPSDTSHLDGDQWAMRCLMACKDEGIPSPSLIVFSGRGVHLKWILDKPIPRQALPRWNLAQKCLVERFAYLGADASAKDASRVLRLEGTRNSKTNEICRVVWADNGPDGKPIRHAFDTLFDELVAIPRRQLEARQKARKSAPQLKLIKGARHGLRKIEYRSLAWDRLEDLRKLAELRAGNLEGQRMLFLHWGVNFLMLAEPIKANQLHHEARALGRELAPQWTYQESELGTLYEKAQAYVAGERIEFNGRQYPPLYTPRNDTLIDLFKITEGEQRQLKTIVSKNEARRRDAARKRQRRREAGAVEREEYRKDMAAQTDQRREQALQLYAQGLSQRAIAKEMGLSQPRVSKLLKG